MRVITVNLNGIRSAHKKGFFTWLNKQNADVVCIQETKAQIHQLTDPAFSPEGYYHEYFDAVKKGYSGVAIYSKCEPRAVTVGLGWPCADEEGRYIQFDFKELSIASIYLPSGTSGDERQNLKYEFLDNYAAHLQSCRRKKREFIICGDLNIAHKKIDIKNWRSNQKNSGFLPEERAWMDKLYDELGYVDAFRQVNQEPDQYTWWSNRANAWANNVGWRIDYHVITPGLKDKVMNASIYRKEKFSDHAPLTIDYDWQLTG